jgi:hypothetical protein
MEYVDLCILLGISVAWFILWRFLHGPSDPSSSSTA